MKMAKPPVRWGSTEPEIKWSTDHLGQHTEEVLAEYGFNDDDVKRLKVKGVIADQ